MFQALIVYLSPHHHHHACPSAKAVAQCLARVVASAKLVDKALPKRAAGSTSGGGGLAAVLTAFKRGLKTIAAADEPGSSPLVASAKGACLELGSEVPAEVVKRAASFLLQSFESLGGGPEVRRGPQEETGNRGGGGVGFYGGFRRFVVSGFGVCCLWG